MCALSIDVELRNEARLPPRIRETQCLLLPIDRIPEDLEALACRAKTQIVHRHLCGQGDLRIAQLPLGSFLCGARRFHAPTHAAKDIELPGCIESRGEELEIGGGVALTGRPAAAQRTQGVRVGVQIHGSTRRTHLGNSRGPRNDELVTRLTNSGCGGLQIEVRLQRLLHERLQLGIAELPPPLDQSGPLTFATFDELRWHIHVRWRVVGTDRAAAQESEPENANRPPGHA